MRMVLSIGSCVGLSAGLLLPVPATADPMDLETAAAVRVDGPFDGAQFGSAISGAGDFDGDGYADLLVGAATADVDNRHGLRCRLHRLRRTRIDLRASGKQSRHPNRGTGGDDLHGFAGSRRGRCE